MKVNSEILSRVRYIFLTHRDDLADQNQYAEYFKANRIFHVEDNNRNLFSAEIPITGTEIFSIDEDIKTIPVLGHEKSLVL